MFAGVGEIGLWHIRDFQMVQLLLSIRLVSRSRRLSLPEAWAYRSVVRSCLVLKCFTYLSVLYFLIALFSSFCGRSCRTWLKIVIYFFTGMTSFWFCIEVFYYKLILTKSWSFLNLFFYGTVLTQTVKRIFYEKYIQHQEGKMMNMIELIFTPGVLLFNI